MCYLTLWFLLCKFLLKYNVHTENCTNYEYSLMNCHKVNRHLIKKQNMIWTREDPLCHCQAQPFSCPGEPLFCISTLWVNLACICIVLKWNFILRYLFHLTSFTELYICEINPFLFILIAMWYSIVWNSKMYLFYS